MNINKCNQKRKGNLFEWEVCKLLSLNYSNGKNDNLFKPTSASGGRATQRFKKGKVTNFGHGDIGLGDPEGKLLLDFFNIECKSGYTEKRKTKTGITKSSWGILEILDGSKKETRFEEFWNESMVDAEKTNREPILIFRRNNRQACIVMWFDVYSKFVEMFDLPRCSMITINHLMFDLVILNFKDFLKWVYLKEFCERSVTYGNQV